MRRVGLVLLILGLAGFLLATSQAERASRPDAALRNPRAAAGWETARWLLVGTGVMGIVLIVLPGPSR